MPLKKTVTRRQFLSTGLAIAGGVSLVALRRALAQAPSSKLYLPLIARNAVSAPRIAAHPQSVTVTAGQAATFTVTADGPAPLHYQWQKNGSNIGTDSASYTTPAATAADNGAIFRVSVTNAGGAVTSAAATLTVTPVIAQPLLGINTQWANSWYPAVPFANVFYSARRPCAVNAWSTPVASDADGNPAADFSIIPYEGAGNMSRFSGIHKLRFIGRADIDGFGFTLSQKTYDAGANITTADLNIDASNNVGLHFTNTRRLPTDTTATGLTGLALMYPGTTFESDFVTPHFVAALARFGIFRPMQAMMPMNPMRTWAERSRPRGTGARDEDGRGTGLPFEQLVLLANTLNKDLWLNVPYYLDGDGQTKLAQLFEYGSDGNLPYTGAFGSTYNAGTNPRPAQHDPATWNPTVSAWYPPLKSSLHVYVELSNELWNFGYGYWGNQIQDDAVAEYNAGDPYHYGILAGSNPGYLRLGRHGRLHKELAERFLAVVGNTNWGGRYRMVLAQQIAWYDMMAGPMTYIATVYGGHQNSGAALGPLVTPEDGRANPYGNPAWPVSRYVHYLSGAPYLAGSTAAEQATYLETEAKAWIAKLKEFSNLYGVKMIAYEGGAEAAAGYSAAGLRQVIANELRYWFSQASDAPFVYFSLADNDGYGLAPTIFDTDATVWPKWGALHDIYAELPPP